MDSAGRSYAGTEAEGQEEGSRENIDEREINGREEENKCTNEKQRRESK